MRPIQKVIHAGFAMCALASASLPALSWTVWPAVDFVWAPRLAAPQAQRAQAVALNDPRSTLFPDSSRHREPGR